VTTEASDHDTLVDPRSFDYGSLFTLRGQTHIVVGAGRGFGETASRLLKHMGANVVGVDMEAANSGLLEDMSSYILLNRVGQTYEAASTAVLLLTPGAGYTTGETINVEGGAMSRNPLGFGSAHAKTLGQVSAVYTPPASASS